MQLTLAAILLGAARTALAQECLVYASSTNPAAAASTDVAPSCGFRGWDTGTNIGYFADAKYASYSACKNLCGAYGGCLSFTYKTADPAVCILYDHIVEGVNTKDAGSPFVFFNDGGLCPGAAVASSAPAVASSSTAKPSTLVTSTTPAAAAKATTTSAAQLTTLYTTSTVCK